MEYHQCNKKAKEAWGRALLDLAVYMAKGILFLITIGPIAFLYKNGADGIDNRRAISRIYEIMGDTLIGNITLFLWGATTLLMISLMRIGIRYIHESDTDSAAPSPGTDDPDNQSTPPTGE